MQRYAVASLLAALVPAGAVLSGQPVTNETIQNAVASLATLTPGGKWKTSCTGAFVDLDGLGNHWRNGTWWFATAAHCLADEDDNVDLSTLPNMALLRTHFGDQATPEFESYEKIGTLEDAVAKWILGNNTDTMGATTVTCPTGPAGGCVDLALVKVKVDPAFQATLRALPVPAFEDPAAVFATGASHTLVGYGDDACTHKGYPPTYGGEPPDVPECTQPAAPQGQSVDTTTGVDPEDLTWSMDDQVRGRGKLRQGVFPLFERLDDVYPGQYMAGYKVFPAPCVDTACATPFVAQAVRNGDSGGPCVDTASLALVGVNSGGYDAKKMHKCSELEPFYDWLCDALESWGSICDARLLPPPPPSSPPSSPPPPSPPSSPPSSPPPYVGELAAIRNVSTSNSSSEIFSAMAKNTASPGDVDLEELVHYAISDISAVWGYHRLVQPDGSEAMPILMFYTHGQATAETLTYNADLVGDLDSRFANAQSWSGGCKESTCGCCTTEEAISCCSSAVMGGPTVKMMRLMYNENLPIKRPALVVHEYYHVVQLAYCNEPYGANPFAWLWEGAATSLQYLWTTHNLANHSEYADYLFGAGASASNPDGVKGQVQKTIESVAGGYIFGTDNELYSGVSSNYDAESTAVLYLAKMTSVELVYKTFLMGVGNQGGYYCATFYGDPTKRDIFFESFFDEGNTNWSTAQDFYDEFNTYVGTLTDPDDLKPAADDLSALFSNTLLCSDVCETANNGVCDASCKHGSDCTDCGIHFKPDTFPVTLRPACESTNSPQCDTPSPSVPPPSVPPPSPPPSASPSPPPSASPSPPPSAPPPAPPSPTRPTLRPGSVGNNDRGSLSTEEAGALIETGLGNDAVIGIVVGALVALVALVLGVYLCKVCHHVTMDDVEVKPAV